MSEIRALVAAGGLALALVGAWQAFRPHADYQGMNVVALANLSFPVSSHNYGLERVAYGGMIIGGLALGAGSLAYQKK